MTVNSASDTLRSFFLQKLYSIFNFKRYLKGAFLGTVRNTNQGI